jgi:PAS domain S-box-containing protein
MGPIDRLGFLKGGGASGERIRRMDWSATPLGPIVAWPQSLCSALALSLAADAPLAVLWGAERLQLYNDAYAELIGDAHPRALGAPCEKTWAAVWPLLAEPIARAWSGKAASLENQQLALRRGGRLTSAILGLSVSPVRDDAGEVGGLLLQVRDTSAWASERAALITQRDHALASLAAQQQAFAMKAGLMGSWELDAATSRIVASDSCRKVFGVGPDDPFDHNDHIIALVHPDDREPRQKAINRAVRAQHDLEIEFRIVKPGGQIGWVLTRGQGVYDENGRAVRFVGVSLDITARRAAEEHQRLLLHELNHRVKNTLTTVQSLALQTRRTTDDPASFNDVFLARIHALAGAHELLTEASWEGASLEEVIHRTLRHHLPRDGAERLQCGGPTIRLGPNAAVTLNMAVHELATNAVKYGALSTPEGRLDVEWRVDLAERRPILDIEWRETCGPPVATPVRRGFGSRLIEQGLAREMDGECRLIFAPEGLTCRLRLPLSSKLTLAA